MSKRTWKLFVMDMLESIEKIESYVSDMDYEEFIHDEKTKDAVVRNLEIIGEAANKIPKNIQNAYKEIPWSQIVGFKTSPDSWVFCNRLSHSLGYYY